MYYLSKHYEKKVMLFIDEYDVPLQEAYIRGYYDEMIALIRNLLTSALKDNIYLEKSMITGILRVAKESIFSGLNNLEVDTILGYDFNDKFGFVKEEIEELLKYYTKMDEIENIKIENIRGKLNCELKIPNEEVHIFYENLIEKWFSETLTSQKYELMLKTLLSGDIKIFEGLFKDFVINNLSYFDVSGKEPERVYHAFVLGMLISLSKDYEVKSNKESGYGRYDVMIIPKDASKMGIIMEFKKIDYFLDDTIEESTKEALKQIEDKKYETELLEKGIKDIIKLAIVFKGKEVKVTSA